jgi:hypothetical protein
VKRAELIEDRKRNGPPGAVAMFEELPIIASSETTDVFDTRVFRNGVRVDGDPFPFKAWGPINFQSLSLPTP